MNIIHTLPLLIKEERLQEEMIILDACMRSLSQTAGTKIVIYNQGGISNERLKALLEPYPLDAVLLGSGKDEGISKARQLCFEYIWEHYTHVPYISEIHMDMIFPRNWYEPLLQFLKSSDEPLVSPCLLTAQGELLPLYTGRSLIPIPEKFNVEAVLKRLRQINQKLHSNKIHEGFQHPVVHKSRALKHIGGYDYRFLIEKQGYEDDSMLLGYSYYMGTRHQWRPKCYQASWVYHASIDQYMPHSEQHEAVHHNMKGLQTQYGAYGLKELARLHGQFSGAHFQKQFHTAVTPK